jgi:glycosyltransferase A (GT-A) superfamily protein (DUF2064 family)
LFARPPRPGEVKTRLAARVGAAAAAEVAAAMLEDAIDAVLAVAALRPIWACTEAVSARVEVWPQGDGDLSARVERVLAAGAPFGGALALGPDTLGMDPEALGAAAAAVRAGEAALGRAEDGGFWCLGLRAVPAGLLAGVGWSAPTTADEVEARLRAAGIVVRALPVRRDVDGWDDLVALLNTPAWHPTSPRLLAVARRLSG